MRAVQPPEEEPSIRLGKVFAQPGLVDLPVAVLAAVEQHHRQPVTELGAEGAVAGRRSLVYIGGRQVEVKFRGQLVELSVHPIADRAAGAGQQLHLWAAHGPSVAGVTAARSPT